MLRLGSLFFSLGLMAQATTSREETEGKSNVRRSLTGLSDYTVTNFQKQESNLVIQPHQPPPADGDGWKTIQVFFGNDRTLEQEAEKFVRRPQRKERGFEWYGQANQDMIVAALLRHKKNGFFIDLASNEAVEDSNTYGLEKFLDWDGLCMDANPDYWLKLAQRKCRLVGAVVGHDRMEEVEFILKKGRGGIKKEGMDNANNRKDPATKFLTVPLVEILKRNDVPSMIDYLSLDVEGAEEYIMSDFPFDQYQIKVITIERPSPSLQGLLEKNGYINLAQISWFGEQLYVHKEALPELDIDTARANMWSDRTEWYYKEDKRD